MAQAIMVPKRFHTGVAMPTLTLKNVPVDLHARLKASAERHRRSLNREILARLERDVERPSCEAEEYERRMRAFTARLPRVEHAKATGHKRRGRP